MMCRSAAQPLHPPSKPRTIRSLRSMACLGCRPPSKPSRLANSRSSRWARCRVVPAAETRPPRPQATGAGTGTSCKPSSVRAGQCPTRGDHVSGAAVADGLLHATRLDPRITGATASRRSRLLALARGGVCRAPSVTGTGGALLPHRFTLACDRSHIGGLFSVALSLTRSPRAGGCYPPPSSCRARTFLATR